MKTNKYYFLKDTRARIPFSVIGIFLILGSSVTTVYVTRLEQQKSMEISSNMDFDRVEHLIRLAEADIATALNIAGMKALKEIGKEPVIIPNTGTGYGQTTSEVNKNRIREIVKDELNIYLTANYLYDVFNDGLYAINVVIPDDEVYPIASRDSISIRHLNMDVYRSFTVPIIGPSDKLDNQPVYLVAGVPVVFEIRKIDDSSDEAVATRAINVSSIITSRYPLLKALVDNYHNTINGNFNSLWTLTTALSNIYSLVRGYKHYSSGKPLNVVDNRHLALLVNGGLLFEEALSFSSIDPLTLVEFARKSWKTLKKGMGDESTTSIFNSIDGMGFDFDIDEFSQGTANIEAGDEVNTSIEDCPYLNLSEIAERVLYNISSVTLIFEDENGNVVEETILFEGNIEKKIRETVLKWANQSYLLNKTIKHLGKNETTNEMIEDIAFQIYHADMHTMVKERRVIEEIWGGHGDYGNDSGYSSWYFDGFSFVSDELLKPEKGSVVHGSELYAEEYNVSWWRTHYWYKWVLQNISGNMTLVKVWNNVTDTMVEEVTLGVVLDHYSTYEDSQNNVMQDDVVDVFYHNYTMDDPNLNDTLDKYISAFPPSHSSKQDLIKTGDVGDTDLYYSTPGNYNDWVKEDSWDALDYILGLTCDIELDPTINSTNYPNPLDLIDKAKEDLEKKHNSNISLYLNISKYQTGSLFSSVGMKAVYYARDWYVYKVKEDIENVFAGINNTISEKLEETLSKYAPDLDASEIKNTLRETKDALTNGFTIPFGFDIKLVRRANNAEVWNETVRCAVDQYPNYLDPMEKTGFGDEEIWTLKLRNRCTLGPTGFPILPLTPVTPWIVTLNIWVIDVEGEYAEFKVIDSTDETLFNPLLGHEPQIYVRKKDMIRAPDGTLLGENTRLDFSFTTVAFGVVSSWGMMVGDIQPNFFDEHTPGYD